MEDIEEMDVWCKEDTGMQKKLGRDMSGRTRHTTLEGKGRLIQGNFFTAPPLKGLTTEKKHLKQTYLMQEKKLGGDLSGRTRHTTLCSLRFKYI